MGLLCCLNESSRLGQIFLILINIVFAVLGIGLIVIGAYVRLTKAIDGYIINMLRAVNLGGLVLGDVIVVLSAFIIAIGVFTLVVAALGGFGACLKKKALLIVYVIVLLLIVIIEFAIFVIWVKFIYGTDTWLREQFNNVFRFYNGGSNDVYTRGLNHMFMLLDCCGSAPITRFQNDFQRLQTTWWTNPTRGFNVIPYTCCRDSNLRNFMVGNNPQCTAQLQFHRTRGCYDVMRRMFTDVSAPGIAVVVILIITEVIAIVSAILIIVRINRLRKQTLDPSNPSLYKKGVHDIPLPDSKPR